MDSAIPKLAIVYDDDLYHCPPAAGESRSHLSRQVVSRDLLRAILRFGKSRDLIALVYKASSQQSLRELWQAEAGFFSVPRSLQIVPEQSFHAKFLSAAPACQLYTACPLVSRYAWARWQAGPPAFALSGTTHALATTGVVQRLCELVTAPFESYDALICTSRCATEAIRSITTTYADYLRDRHGGSPQLRLQLPVIPLGVDTEDYRPPSPERRAAQRQALDILPDEVAVFFSGRLAFHSKAHPFPMLSGLAEAARQTNKKVHLLLCGWVNQPVKEAILQGAMYFAPGIRLSMIDGTNPDNYRAGLQAADLFTSLSDTLLETFGLVLVEAMASGLPVVASDWNGYRDLVVQGETGLLVPTYTLSGANANSTSRLLFGEIGIDQFLGECNQAVAVDVPACAEAYTRLIGDPALRQAMGAAGRQKAVDHFAWPRIVRAYESQWQAQESERLAQLQHFTGKGVSYHGPACYPAPDCSFAGHPTAVLQADDLLQASEGAEERMDTLHQHRLTNYLESNRITDLSLLRAVLAKSKAPCSIDALEAPLRQAGHSDQLGRATLAWMLKYDLLRLVRPTPLP